MFLAVRKNNLFICVRGHIPSLNCSNVAAIRCPKVWKGAAWCQKTPSKTTRTELNWHQRLKQKVCSLGQWPRLAHNGRLHDRKSTFNAEVISGHCLGHPQPVSFTPLPKNQESCLVLNERTNNLTPSIWRSKPPACNYNLQVFDSTRVLRVRVPLASLSVHSGVRGFCCPSPKKHLSGEEPSSLPQDLRESVSCQQDAKAPAPHHEHFQFKELVSEVSAIVLHLSHSIGGKLFASP